MKIKFKKHIALIGVLFFWIGVSSVYADREEYDFTLYKGERSPYVLHFPITLEGPGEIKVYVNVTTADVNLKKPLNVSIIQKRDKNQVQAVRLYESKKKSVQLKHAVDSNELARGTNYIIALTNFSKKRNAAGKILIVYHGKNGVEEGARPVYPDLSITNMWLTNENLLAVEVINNGPGSLPSIYWQKNVPDLYFFRDNKDWGGFNLKIIDPQMSLRHVGGKVVYVSILKITGTEKIKAIIDHNNTIREENENNNEIRRELTGKSTGPVYPDLLISKMWLTTDNKVAVEVINNGPGVVPAVYWEKDMPTLYLFRNGKGWGGTTLPLFDPQKKLAKIGGKEVYISNSLQISGTETIVTVIDYHDTVRESNEQNNQMTKELKAR
jgi:hypothetical protein